MARRSIIGMGVGFLILSALYFIRPGIWGTHLTGFHTLIHLVTGGVAILAGVRESERFTAWTALVLGLIYIAVAIAGFRLGVWTLPTAGVPGPGNPTMWILLPGHLELGFRDHIVHLVAGSAFVGIFAIGLASSRTTEADPAGSA